MNHASYDPGPGKKFLGVLNLEARGNEVYFGFIRFERSIGARAGPGEQLESINELLVSRADLGIVPFLLE